MNQELKKSGKQQLTVFDCWLTSDFWFDGTCLSASGAALRAAYGSLPRRNGLVQLFLPPFPV
jgi:hypothetical protein